jgi:hypothetical protein
MPRYHDLTQRMTDIAQRPDIANDGEIEELAEEFAELCTDANSRLGEIRQLLGKGLRAEAVSRAQRDPDLLELVMALDFLFLARWNELCNQVNVPLAALLARETAGDLNEAYTAQQPLEGLLSQHRLLALAKASLRDRLLVLREISDKDPNNDAWSKDIVTLEKSRVRELESDVESAGDKKDLTEIASLHREINITQWQVPIPENVQAKVSRLHQVLRRQSLIAEFEAIVTNLNIALQKGDVDAMRQLLTAGEQTAVQIQPPLQAELYAKLEGPRQAIAAAASQAEVQAQFDIALDKLRHSLQTNISKSNLVTYRTILESKIAAAEQYGLVIPAAVVVQARRKLKEIDSQQRRDFVFKIFAVSFTCVVLAATVTGIVLFLNSSSAREAEVAKFTTLFEQGDYQNIIAAFDRLVSEGSPYADNQEILKIQNEAHTRFSAAELIKARLKTLVESLEMNGVEVFSSADVEEARGLADPVQDLDMIVRLDKFELDVEDFRNRSAQARQEAYADQYRGISLAVDELALKDTLLTKEKLDKVQGELELLREQYLNIANKSLIQTRLGQINELRTRMKTDINFINLKNELTVSSGIASQYSNALRNLQKFLLTNPLDAQMKNDIEFVLLEANYWTGVVAWGQFYSVQFQPDLITKSPLKLAAEQAKVAIEKGTSLVQMYPEFKTKSEFLDRKDALLLIAQRPTADIVMLRAELRRIIGSTPAVLIANKEGQKVTYNLQDLLPWAAFSAKNIGGKIIFKSFKNRDYELGEYGHREIDIVYYGSSPNRILQEEIFSLLDTLNGNVKSWEEIFLDALDVLFDISKTTFPNQFKGLLGVKHQIPLPAIQRLFICRTLLSLANEHSVVLSEEFTGALRALETADVDNGIDFVAPTTDQSRLTNRNADETLRALQEKLDQSRPQVLRQLGEFSNTPKSAPLWVGWMDVREGGYTVRFSEGKPNSGAMFTVISDGADTSKAIIIELGNANGGVLQIPENSVGSNFRHRFGRPVFTYAVPKTKE